MLSLAATKRTLLLAASIAGTSLFLAAMFGAVPALATRGWGAFDATQLAATQPKLRVIADADASTGKAIELHRLEALKTVLLADPLRDATATAVALRVRGNTCNDKRTTFTIKVDGKALLSVDATPTWSHQLVPLPNSILNSTKLPFVGSLHKWVILINNTDSDSLTCARKLWIDHGGWLTTGVLQSTDMTVTGAQYPYPAATTGYERIAASNIPSKARRFVRLTENLRLSGHPLASAIYGDKLTIVGRTNLCGLEPAQIAVRIGTVDLGVVSLNQPHWVTRSIQIPFNLDHRDIHLTFLNPYRDASCVRTADIDWVFGFIPSIE